MVDPLYHATRQMWGEGQAAAGMGEPALTGGVGGGGGGGHHSQQQSCGTRKVSSYIPNIFAHLFMYVSI